MRFGFDAMVAALGSLPPLLASARLPEGRRRFNHLGECGRSGGGGCWKAMVQPQTLQGASATYAKEMERVSAKESLLLSVSITLYGKSFDF